MTQWQQIDAYLNVDVAAVYLQLLSTSYDLKTLKSHFKLITLTYKWLTDDSEKCTDSGFVHAHALKTRRNLHYQPRVNVAPPQGGKSLR